MAVTLSDVRVHVADVPRLIVPPSQSPFFIGTADPATPTFQLDLKYKSYVAGSLLVYQSTGANVWTAVSPSGYTFEPVLMRLTFNPLLTTGNQIGIRMQFTVYSDSDLQSVLNQALQLWQQDDLVLKKCQLDVIGMNMMDFDRLSIVHTADYSRDPNALINAQLKRADQLMKELSGQPRANADVPFAAFVAPALRSVIPMR